METKRAIVLSTTRGDFAPITSCDDLTVGELISMLESVDPTLHLYVGTDYGGTYWHAYGSLKTDDVFEIEIIEPEEEISEVRIVGNVE